MTTYVLLALTDDGRASAYDEHVTADGKMILTAYAPTASGNDRGQFVTFEIAGYSIDVVALPEVKL